jgi:hypothetical protein
MTAAVRTSRLWAAIRQGVVVLAASTSYICMFAFSLFLYSFLSIPHAYALSSIPLSPSPVTISRRCITSSSRSYDILSLISFNSKKLSTLLRDPSSIQLNRKQKVFSVHRFCQLSLKNHRLLSPSQILDDLQLDDRMIWERRRSRSGCLSDSSSSRHRRHLRD